MVSSTNMSKTTYTSNLTGQYIVNAETGIATTYKVGTMNENLYFKVADATHRNSTGDANIYFYDSPEHYVRHRFSRMRYRIRSDSKTKMMYDRQRKDEMLLNQDNQLIHWSLVDNNGSPTDTNNNKAYMVPFVNPSYMLRWTTRRNEQLNRINIDTSNEVDTHNETD